MKYLKRSLSDTFSGQIQTLFVVIVGGLIGPVYLYFDQGAGDAMAKIPYWEAAVIGAVGSLLLMFLWNLAAAPYRIRKERADALEARLSNANAELGIVSPYNVSEEKLAAFAKSFAGSGYHSEKLNVVFNPVSSAAADLAEALQGAIGSIGIECLALSNAMFSPD